MSKASILVTFDSMKDIHSGYFSFGKGLGDALLRENRARFNFQYYLFSETKYFDGEVPIRRRSLIDDIYFSGYNQYDLVHITDQRARLGPGKLQSKKILTVQDMSKADYDRQTHKSVPYLVQAFIDSLSAKIAACHRVVAVSNFVADELIHFIPEAKPKISIIYSGAAKPAMPANNQPGYRPKKQFIFTIGQLSPQKGFHLLPPLLQGNDYELVIAGTDGPYKQRIMEAAYQYGVESRVTITGAVNEADKAWYYQNCAAFVFPSKAEGSGQPVIEAMHFGKPVFLSRLGALPEIGGDAAYYFENFETANMQEIFNKAMLSFNLNNLQSEVIAHAAKFNWENVARQYLALYEELLAGK